MTTPIANAEKKLRQAEFFLALLEAAPREIAMAMRRPASWADQSELLEYYFSACLGSAKAVYYTLRSATGKEPFKGILSNWLESLANQAERDQFERIMIARDTDVHQGQTDAEPMGAMIPNDLREHPSFMYQNPVFFGPPVLTTHVNPDGTEVKGPGLSSSQRLYLNVNGQLVDASTACRGFIDQLISLRDAVAVAQA